MEYFITLSKLQRFLTKCKELFALKSEATLVIRYKTNEMDDIYESTSDYTANLAAYNAIESGNGASVRVSILWSSGEYSFYSVYNYIPSGMEGEFVFGITTGNGDSKVCHITGHQFDYMS